MIRYLVIIIDFSKSTLKQDFRPNRASVIKTLVSNFVKQFLDQNPQSKLSLVATIKEQAFLVTDFTNSTQESVQRLKKLDDFEGYPTFLNSLELALSQLKTLVPSFSRKEILIINSSNSICDAGDIDKTI